MATIGTEANWESMIVRADERIAQWWAEAQKFGGRSFREHMLGSGHSSYQWHLGHMKKPQSARLISSRGPAYRAGALAKGASHAGHAIGATLGFDYFAAATEHYAGMRTTGPTFTRLGRGIGVTAPGGMGPPSPVTASAKYTASRTVSSLGRRGASVAKVAMAGLLPGFALWGASESPHGMGIGFAEQVAGFAAFGMGASVGLASGGWLGGTAVKAAGKIPVVKTLIGANTLATGAGLAAGLGWLIGGFVAFEAAMWSVGFALHTLPTFAKQFQKDMARSGFGGDFIDSAGAATMRQRSLQVMGKSFANARSALGQEASLLHV